MSCPSTKPSHWPPPPFSFFFCFFKNLLRLKINILSSVYPEIICPDQKGPAPPSESNGRPLNQCIISIHSNLIEFYRTTHLVCKSSLLLCMFFFFWGRRDFNIGFSGRDMSMNVWNWLSGCSLVDIGIWIILLFYHWSNSKMIHMLFMYDYNTEYTTTHSATCYDVHVYINIIRKLWLRFNLTIVYQSL